MTRQSCLQVPRVQLITAHQVAKARLGTCTTGAAGTTRQERGLDIMTKRTQCGLNPSGKVFIELETMRRPAALDRNFDNSFANHVGSITNSCRNVLLLERRILTQYRCRGLASGQVVEDYRHRNTCATKTNGTVHDSRVGDDVWLPVHSDLDGRWLPNTYYTLALDRSKRGFRDHATDIRISATRRFSAENTSAGASASATCLQHDEPATRQAIAALSLCQPYFPTCKKGIGAPAYMFCGNFPSQRSALIFSTSMRRSSSTSLFCASAAFCTRSASAWAVATLRLA